MNADAALDWCKNFVMSVPSASEFIDENALRLSGEPQEKIDSEIKKFGHEMFAGMQTQPLSRAKRFALTLATCALIRERIAEMQRSGSGRA